METTVILNEYEAKQFLLYQKHHDLFERLNDAGAFDLTFGKITMNFAFGELQNVVKESVVWRLDK